MFSFPGDEEGEAFDKKDDDGDDARDQRGEGVIALIHRVKELEDGCRLFPLGRYYEDGGFKYFLQIHECDRAGKVKVKVSKWIDTPDLPRYTEYINAWHDFQKQVQAAFARIRMQDGEEESKNAQIKQMCMYILNIMYVARYEENRDFYEQFEMRLEHLKELLESGI